MFAWEFLVLHEAVPASQWQDEPIYEKGVLGFAQMNGGANELLEFSEWQDVDSHENGVSGTCTQDIGARTRTRNFFQ